MAAVAFSGFSTRTHRATGIGWSHHHLLPRRERGVTAQSSLGPPMAPGVDRPTSIVDCSLTGRHAAVPRSKTAASGG
jgi:hypothetical protein